MTHHDVGKSKVGMSPKGSSEMEEKQGEMGESKRGMSGMGGPEAEESSREVGVGPHTMQTESPSTSVESKEGFAMSGSKGTEGTVHSSKRGESKIR